MVPMHAEKKRKEALHEPQGRAGCPQPAGPRRGEDTALYQLAWFMVPMHAEKRKGAFHERQCAAGILPAEGSVLWHGPARSGFMVPLREPDVFAPFHCPKCCGPPGIVTSKKLTNSPLDSFGQRLFSPWL